MNKERGYSSLSWLKYLLRNATCVAGSAYGLRKKQVRKDDMYMMTALWMEQSPWSFKYQKKQMIVDSEETNLNGEEKTLNVVGEEKTLNVVGAVFVLPNDRVLSIDCSRRNKAIQNGDEPEGIVHGAVQALIKYPDRVKDCKVYLSRKPCAHCVKMLVQAAVEKVFYLPLRPEKDDTEENKNVDALFQVSTVSKSFFVPCITEADVEELEKQEKKPYGTNIKNLGNKGKNYAKTEWEKWMPKIESALSWEEFDGKEIMKQVDDDMNLMFQWFGLATLGTGHKKIMDWELVNDKTQEKEEFSGVASHLSRLAQMLSNRSDDPNRGVGCVIAVDDEIVSVGWNGFPSKALYGNHPRGSTKDNAASKFPHVIHAEQNALMCRNRRDLTDSIAFVNLTPCNECMAMLYQCGVKTVVLPSIGVAVKGRETYFYSLFKLNKLRVYKQKEQKTSTG